jgi:hypothetical protein
MSIAIQGQSKDYISYGSTILYHQNKMQSSLPPTAKKGEGLML